MLAYIKYYCNYQVVRKIYISIGIYIFINLVSVNFSEIKAENVLSTVTDSTIKTIKDFTDRSEDWKRYVRNFRVAHNLSISLGVFFEGWKVFDYKVNDSFSEVKDVYMKGVDISLRYNYDIQIYSGLGYSIGSSFFYKNALNSSEELEYLNEYNLPSLFIGLVFNFNPMFRVYCGGDLYILRLIDLERKDYPNEEIDISVMELRLVNILDIFTSLNRGIRLELDYSKSFDKKYEYNSGKETPTKYRISNIIFKIGFVYTIM